MKKFNFFRYCMMMAVALFAGAAMTACGDDDDTTTEGPEVEYKTPTVTLTAGEATDATLSFTVATTDATTLAYTYIKKGNMAPTPADVLAKGTKLEAAASQSVTIEGLKDKTSYQIFAAVTNDGGEQVLSKALEMTTAEKPNDGPGHVQPSGDNFIQFGNGEKEGISYAAFDTNGGANVNFHLTSSDKVETFMDLFYVETCKFYLTINPESRMAWETEGEVNVAEMGSFSGYVRVTENLGVGGSYNSWYCMAGDPGASGKFSVTKLDNGEYEISVDVTLPAFMGATEPMKVKAYYKGEVRDGDKEANEKPGNGGGGSTDMVPLPEGNAFTAGDVTKEIKSVVWEADPANDYMSWNVYFCTVEGIDKIVDAEKVEHMFACIDVTSASWGAPMLLPSNLGVWFQYVDAEGNVAAQWLPSDVDYTGEANGGIMEDGSMRFTCQTTAVGGLAINYNGPTVWDDRYWEDAPPTVIE